MKWVQGHLVYDCQTQRVHLVGSGLDHDFRCGEPIELRMGEQWCRGRVERSQSMGWYWTDDRANLRLCDGDEARIWDGRCWPAMERSGPER